MICVENNLNMVNDLWIDLEKLVSFSVSKSLCVNILDCFFLEIMDQILFDKNNGGPDEKSQSKGL